MLPTLLATKFIFLSLSRSLALSPTLSLSRALSLSLPPPPNPLSLKTISMGFSCPCSRCHTFFSSSTRDPRRYTWPCCGVGCSPLDEVRASHTGSCLTVIQKTYIHKQTHTHDVLMRYLSFGMFGVKCSLNITCIYDCKWSGFVMLKIKRGQDSVGVKKYRVRAPTPIVYTCRHRSARGPYPSCSALYKKCLLKCCQVK